MNSFIKALHPTLNEERLHARRSQEKALCILRHFGQGKYFMEQSFAKPMK
jgi:hypothetical protein